jgi:MATE family multidrug resistance protein
MGEAMSFMPPPDRRKQIVTLAVPIVAGMLSQNVLNVIDTAMVGSLGDVALAATGMGGFANFMAISFIMGLSSGVQAIAARRMGEGRSEILAVALNAGLVLAIVWAIPWTALLHSLAYEMFGVLISDPAVIAEGVPYFRIRVLGALGVGINFAFRGYWNGINLPKLYMGTLFVSHLTNLFLNWVFIFGNLGAPEMGTYGAGLASMIATYVGSATYIGLGIHHARKNGFLKVVPDIEMFRTLTRLTLPASLAQMSMATGYTALMWVVGQTGTSELAAANVVLTITLVAILPGVAFGLVATSLVGQALGRKDVDDAHRWGWDVVKIGSISLAVLGLPMVLAPDLILSLFLHEASTRVLAIIPLQLVGATIAADAVGLILLNALYGAGHSKPVFIVSTVCQWGVGLPLAYIFGPIMGLGLGWIWAGMLLYRGIQAIVYAMMWKRKSWANIAV